MMLKPDGAIPKGVKWFRVCVERLLLLAMTKCCSVHHAGVFTFGFFQRVYNIQLGS
jgi:hypothetical protein